MESSYMILTDKYNVIYFPILFQFQKILFRLHIWEYLKVYLIALS